MAYYKVRNRGPEPVTFPSPFLGLLRPNDFRILEAASDAELHEKLSGLTGQSAARFVSELFNVEPSSGPADPLLADSIEANTLPGAALVADSIPGSALAPDALQASFIRFAGLAAPGPINVPGLLVGDRVYSVLQLSDNSLSLAFNSTVSVADTLTQTQNADLSLETYIGLVTRRGS